MDVQNNMAETQHTQCQWQLHAWAAASPLRSAI